MKKKYLYLLSLIALLIPCKVFAESNVIINCNSNNIVNDILECSLIADVDDGVIYNKVEGSISASNASSVSFINSQNFAGSIKNNHLTIQSNSEVGSVTLGNIKINISNLIAETLEIKMSNIKFFNNDVEVSNVSSANSIVKVASTVNTLESLEVTNCNECKLSPSFDAENTVYTVTTNASSITINAKASSNAKLSGDGMGNLKLKEGRNSFQIIVTSESGDSKIYKIYVTRQVTKSSDNSLKKLSINNGDIEPVLSNNVTTYKANVDDSKVVISAVANDDKATIVGTGEQTLQYGENKFEVIVTAENGASKSYTLVIIRNKEITEDDLFLGSLSIDGEDIKLDEDVTEYTYNVSSDVNEVDISAKANNNFKVDIKGNEDLVAGENIVTITITGENDITKVYTVTINKEDKKELEGLYLKDLIIEGYGLSFSPETLEYTVTINDEKELNISAFASDENYVVELNGNEDLHDGSIIKIIVSDQEGNSNIYKINVKELEKVVDTSKQESDINYIPFIMIGLFGVLFIVDVILLIKKIINK